MRDLRSANGVRVAGKLIANDVRVRLAAGERFQLGDVTVSVTPIVAVPRKGRSGVGES